MTKAILGQALALVLLATAASAALAPDISLRPQPRPGGAGHAHEGAVSETPVLSQAVPVSPRPRARPGARRTVAADTRPAPSADVAAVVAAAVVVPPPPRTGGAPVPDPGDRAGRVVLAASGAAVRLSPRPDPRPGDLMARSVVRTAGVRTPSPTPLVTGRRGAVCGDRAIRGETVAPIPGRLRGCGVSNPVRVSAVAGVALTQASIMDCNTAKALKTWINGSVKPAVGRLGGGVASLKVLAHYSCRTRNNVRGAKISEHGRGKAIDIGAINLKNGVAIDVLRGWRDEFQGRLLRRIHAEACGTFGTVLGPKSDRYHQNHFHLDTARHRGGSYCR